MGRQQQFDEATVLTKAMHAFRRHGYAAVSIKILETETGLSSGSIYNSFGSKDAIFDRVMAHYNDTVVDKRIRQYLVAREPLAGLVALFQSLLEEPDNTAYGCLLTNCAIEFSGQDPMVARAVAAGFDRFLAAFKTVLLTRPDTQEDAAELMSLRLLAYYQGLLVLIRQGYDKERLRQSIEPEIRAIIGQAPA